MEKSKEPIRLRQRKTPNGLTSLYLDIYLNGKRSYEYLRLYLVSEKTREDKKKNKETLQLAEAIRAKRVVELRNGEFGFKSDYAEETLFFDYYEKLCEASDAVEMLKIRKLSRLIRHPRSKYKDIHYLCERQGRILIS